MNIFCPIQIGHGFTHSNTAGVKDVAQTRQGKWFASKYFLCTLSVMLNEWKFGEKKIAQPMKFGAIFVVWEKQGSGRYWAAQVEDGSGSFWPSCWCSSCLERCFVYLRICLLFRKVFDSDLAPSTGSGLAVEWPETVYLFNVVSLNISHHVWLVRGPGFFSCEEFDTAWNKNCPFLTTWAFAALVYGFIDFDEFWNNVGFLT